MSCTDQAPAKEKTLALQDALDLLAGKWKISILRNLSFSAMRFKDLQEALAGISPKVLTRELQQMEQNLLVSRTVNNTKPITVTYALTAHALETEAAIRALLDFGLEHRKKIKAW